MGTKRGYKTAKMGTKQRIWVQNRQVKHCLKANFLRIENNSPKKKLFDIHRNYFYIK